MRKKFIAVALAAALACNMTVAPAAAQPLTGLSVFRGLFGGDSSDKKDEKKDDKEDAASEDKVESQESATKDGASKTTSSSGAALDIGKGNIVIGPKEISAFDTQGNPVTATSSKYVITGYSEENAIMVQSGANANVVLSNATIIRTAEGESPFWLADDAGNVQVTLEGNNTLQGGPGAAAIQKNCTHNGTSCKCKRLEITCGNTSSGHVCDSDCGTLNATGSGGAAAIGGAAGMGSANITIKGGMITANGGVGGASGGIGTGVDITGGVVNAGAVNGKDGSGSNAMRGNTLVFADSNAGLERDKGILYENGAGTVYGSVKMTQGMADYLPAGSALTIPEGSSLTIDEGTVLPNAENVIGEVTVKQAKKTPTPEPTVEATPDAAPVMEEDQQEAQAQADGDPTYSESTIQITRLTSSSGSEITGTPREIEYGDRVTVDVTVTLSPLVISGNVPTGTGDQVTFHLGSSSSPVIGSVALDSGEGAGTFTKSAVIPFSGGDFAPNTEYDLVAVYSGKPGFTGNQFVQRIKINQGSVRLSSTGWSKQDAIAGRPLSDIDLNGDQGVNIKTTNAAGETVEGEWSWGKIVGPDGSLGANVYTGTVLYPTTAEYNNRYQLIFTPKDSKYGGNTAIATINAIAANLTESENSTAKVTPGDDKKYNGWYNVASGDITVELPGFTLLSKQDEPATQKEWESAKWTNSIKINDMFYDGQYPYAIFAKRTVNGEIWVLNLKDLKIDKLYPIIDEGTAGYSTVVTGSQATLTFNASNESSQSGVKEYRCDAVARRDTSGKLVPPLKLSGPSDIKKIVEGSPASMVFTKLNALSDHDVYVFVTDNAGNTTKYITRIIDETSGDVIKPNPSGKPISGVSWNENDNNRYGFAFQTDKADIDGTIRFDVIDGITGGTKRGTVAFGDMVTAVFEPKSGNPGTLTYSWYRLKDADQAPQEISEARGQATYKVQAADIDHFLICRVNGSNTSQAGYVQETLGHRVIRQACPSEFYPTNGVVDNDNKTFSFTGIYDNDLRGPTYEWRMNGGGWQDVPSSVDGVNFVINVGDNTIPAGQLEVRVKESNLYFESPPSSYLKNEEDFISPHELDVSLNGLPQYGETLTADINTTAISPSDIRFQWSYEEGGNISNEGSTYVLGKSDIGKHIKVQVIWVGHEGANSSAISKTIMPRDVRAVINVTPKEYDGTTTAEATVTIDGLVNGDDLSGAAEVEFEDPNAGENKNVKVKKTDKIGDAATKLCYNMDFNKSDVKGTIQPRKLNLSITASDKVYDGTTDAQVSVSANALPGDNIIVSGTGAFVDKNAGTNKQVTSQDIEITGDDAANYTAVGSTATTTANITPKNIELESISVADKVYDDTTDATITATFKGAVDDVSYTYKAAFETPNVGKDKKVTASITLTGESATNYVLASGDIVGKGNIVKALAPYEDSDIPKDLTGIEGKKLSSVYIGSGFTWKDPATVMKTVGRHNYPAYYNPDPNQYGNREIELEVLVQCAKHTWGDWTITKDPTKEEMGERQRICSVCGYTEVETIARAPYIANDDTKVGWGDITQAINNASSGTEIPVVMNGTETLPASVLEALQGREVSLVLQMGEGITWTIRGEDITSSSLKDINMALTMYTDNIPSDVIDPYVKGKTAVQLHLAYSGEFGFVATLRVPFSDEFAGINSTLYYYNPNRGRLEQMDKNRITDDGIGRYDFNHASDYVVIIDKASDTQGGDTTPSSNGATVTPGTTGATNASGAAGQATGTAARTTSANNARFISSNGAKTSDDTPIMVYAILLIVGAAGIASVGYYRRKRK